MQALLGKNGLQAEAPEDDMLYEAEVTDTIDANDTCPLNRLRKGITKVRASPQRLQHFAVCVEVNGCPDLELIRDVRTRWNPTYAMAKRAITLKTAYVSM
ncbi:hypothetical protein BGX26_009100, partial [Mortierella sp. AD094]